MTSAEAPDSHRVLGSLQAVLSAARPVAGPTGELRLQRRGTTITAWHRGEGESDFCELARDEHATRDDVIFGVKIWSKIACGGISADVVDLALQATPAARQIPRLERRPDPRRA
jgi:hypothetical protein